MLIHEVEQRSDEWYALRAGKPTASEFSKIITSKGDPSKSAAKYAMTLAGEIYAGKSLDAWEGNSHTERGRELEGEAISHYEFTRGVTVNTVGFITDDKNQYGCSPDGLINDDGMIEVKCLKAENHIEAILYHKKHGQCQAKYVQQTQGQLMICKRKWCDLVFYHPDLPRLTIRQESANDLHESLLRELNFLLIKRDNTVDVLKSV